MNESKTVVIEQPNPQPTKKQETQKLDDLVEKSQSVVYEVSSVFPFQLFPDKAILDASKITLVYKGLFYKHIFPILYDDLLSAKVTRGLIFASLSFEVRGFEVNPEPITHLWPDQAGKAERRIMGLLSAKRQNIQTAKISTTKLKNEVKKIGSSEEKPENLF